MDISELFYYTYYITNIKYFHLIKLSGVKYTYTTLVVDI